VRGVEAWAERKRAAAHDASFLLESGLNLFKTPLDRDSEGESAALARSISAQYD
jgi:hypothetical protein